MRRSDCGVELGLGDEHRGSQVGTGQISATEVRPEQIGPIEVDTGQPGADEKRPTQISAPQVGTAQVGTDEVDPTVVAAGQPGPSRGADLGEQVSDGGPPGGYVDCPEIAGFDVGGELLGASAKPVIRRYRPGLLEVPEHLVDLPCRGECREHRGAAVPGELLGDALAGTEAVEGDASGEAAIAELGVDRTAMILAEVRAGLSGRFVDRELGRPDERQGDTAQPDAPTAVRA